MAGALNGELDHHFESNVKIFAHPDWLKNYASGQPVYPLCWEIDVSNKCQYNCDHCCWASNIKSNRVQLPQNRLFTLIQEIKDLDAKSIIWTGGGDPLTYPGIRDAVTRSKSLGLENAMFTNGLGMNAQNSRVFGQSLKWIRFHLSASEAPDYARIHGVPARYFPVVVNNIKRFIDNPDRVANVGIGVAVNQSNFTAAQKMPEFAMQLGADFFQAKLDLEHLSSYNYMEWWFEEVVPFFLAEKDRLAGRVRVFYNPQQSALDPAYCHAHRITTAITADGEVAFCKMLRGASTLSVGNIHNQSLKDILDSQKHDDLASRLTPRTCQVYDVHCPYRKTNQSVELFTRGQNQDSSLPPSMPDINFF